MVLMIQISWISIISKFAYAHLYFYHSAVPLMITFETKVTINPAKIITTKPMIAAVNAFLPWQNRSSLPALVIITKPPYIMAMTEAAAATESAIVIALL